MPVKRQTRLLLTMVTAAGVGAGLGSMSNDDARIATGNNSAQSACAQRCKAAHRDTVKICIEGHDPHEFDPEDRGRCMEEAARLLGQCMKGCRDTRDRRLAAKGVPQSDALRIR